MTDATTQYLWIEVDAKEELPPATDYYNGKTSDLVPILGETYRNPEGGRVNAGVYDYGKKEWGTLFPGTYKVEKWLKKVPIEDFLKSISND